MKPQVDPHMEAQESEILTSDRKIAKYDPSHLRFNSAKNEKLLINKSMTPMNNMESHDILETDLIGQISAVNASAIKRNINKNLLFGDSNSF